MDEIEKLKALLDEYKIQNDTFRKKLFEVQDFCEGKKEYDDIWGIIEVLWHEP